MRLKILLLAVLVGLIVPGCKAGGLGMSTPVTVEVIANTSLTAWLSGEVDRFNQAQVKTSSGQPAQVKLMPVEAGQAAADIAAGQPAPALWIPDNEVWVNVLAQRGQAGFQGNCVSVAQSPLVIALWRPIAEALGWPGRSLGWLDIGSLAADPSAWAYYSGGQFGPKLRLGHTHPGLSGSGASALLAIIQAAQTKTDAVTVEDIRRPMVQASVGSFEGSVSWFSPTTDKLGQTMRERGAGHLGAAVMYESTVIHYTGPEVDIVPIYPFEGTFMATHPACVNGLAGPETQEAAALFRTYLLQPEAQRDAVANGLRPVSKDITVGAPLDAAHGVDLTQPKVVFSSPTVETLYAAQDVWQATRLHINLVMLIDTSGSMSGDKIKNVRQAAVQFMKQMGDNDFITLLAFSTSPALLIQRQQVSQAREPAIAQISQLQSHDKTALYDALGQAAAVIAKSSSPQAANVIVVLTDGMDTSSSHYRLDNSLTEALIAHNTTLFTIAYGYDADEKLLTNLAKLGNGNFYRGTEANIGDIYQEMSAAFGGNVGIGR